MKSHRRLDGVARALAPLAEPAEPIDLAPLAHAAEAIEAAQRLAAKRRVDLADIDRRLDDFHRELNEFIKQNPNCYACGQPISAQVIMAGEHAHA